MVAAAAVVAVAAVVAAAAHGGAGGSRPKPMYAATEVWPSGYSSSASARAVRVTGDQCTGRRPR